MKRWLLMALLVALLGGCSDSKAPQGLGVTPVAGQIVAGRSVEGVNLGDSLEQVSARLGKPEEVDTNEFNKSQSYALYYSKGLELAFNEDKLSMIVCHAPVERWQPYAGATAEGLWVGSTPEEIKAKLGEPTDKLDKALKYPAQGLWFRLDEQGKVESLSVIPPGSKI